MSDITNIQFTVNALITYKIELPVQLSLAAGFYPRTTPVIKDGKKYTLTAGFLLTGEEQGIGKLEDNYPKELAVDFTPLYHGDYEIFFYAHTGEIIRFGATPVEVHDHASVAKGGPAFGTYYSGITPKAVS